MSKRSRFAVLAVMWKVLRAGRRPGAPGLGARVATVPRMLSSTLTGRYRGLSRGRLAAMVVAVLYLVSPIDLAPEAFLGVFGLADDLALAAWLAGTLLVESDQYLEWERSRSTVVHGSVVS